MRLIVMAAIAALLSGTAAAASKVAVVDMERALFLSDAAKASAKQFEKDNQGDIDKVKNLEKELVALKDRLEKDGAIMSDEENRKARKQYDEKAEEMKFFVRKLQQQDQQWQQWHPQKVLQVRQQQRSPTKAREERCGCVMLVSAAVASGWSAK